MRIDLSHYSLPEMFKRNNKDCFYDPFRKRLIEITPEEIVRQQIASFCIAEMHVPQSMIQLEVPMSRVSPGTSGRADIVITEPTENGLSTLAIIECKNRSVSLTDQVVEQAIRYSDIMGSPYIFVTNGNAIEAYKYNEKNNGFDKLSIIPTYNDMKNLSGEIEFSVNNFSRFTISELNNQQLISEYNDSGFAIFGDDTPSDIRTLAVNLFQSLIDNSVQLPSIKTKTFELVKDLGNRYLDYSNAGAGHYEGDYRSFLIKDCNGDNQIISIGVFGTGRGTILDKTQTRTSYTSIVIAIDRFKISKTVLQYNLDTYARYSDQDKCYYLIHDGRISSKKSSDLLKFVSQRSTIQSNTCGHILLGSLPKDRLIQLDKDKELFYNLIEYSLLRDLFKNQ